MKYTDGTITVEAIQFDGTWENALFIAKDWQGNNPNIIAYPRGCDDEAPTEEERAVIHGALVIKTDKGSPEPKPGSWMFMVDGKVDYLWPEEFEERFKVVE